MKRYPCYHLETKTAPFIGKKPPHPAMLSKNRPILLCYLKMLVGNIWIGNSNAKCKHKLQMQNANLKFLPEPKILPKLKIFAQTYFAFRDQKTNFIHPCKHFRWPLLRRMCIMIVIVDFYLHRDIWTSSKPIKILQPIKVIICCVYITCSLLVLLSIP